MRNSMMIKNEDIVPVGYYSIVDPHDGTITHWYCSKRTPEWVRSWPTKAKPGPRLHNRDIPCDNPERKNFLDAYYEKQREYRIAVLLGIIDDPAAGPRFAAFAVRCCICGRVLTDNASKCYGIGPECRSGFSDHLLASYSAAMSAVLANQPHNEKKPA